MKKQAQEFTSIRFERSYHMFFAEAPEVSHDPIELPDGTDLFMYDMIWTLSETFGYRDGIQYLQGVYVDFIISNRAFDGYHMEMKHIGHHLGSSDEEDYSVKTVPGWPELMTEELTLPRDLIEILGSGKDRFYMQVVRMGKRDFSRKSKVKIVYDLGLTEAQIKFLAVDMQRFLQMLNDSPDDLTADQPSPELWSKLKELYTLKMKNGMGVVLN